VPSLGSVFPDFGSPGRDPISRACRLHAQASDHHDRGNLRVARRLAARAQALLERHAGRSHPDVANVLLASALIDEDLGRYGLAQSKVRRAMTILRPLRGDRAFSVLRAQAYEQAGSLAIVRGQYGIARRAYGHARAIAMRSLGPSELATSTTGLGVVHKYLGRFAQAARLYRRALSQVRRKRGPADVAIASILHNLGGLEHARGRFALGERHARRALALRERALGVDHPTVAADKTALAALLDAQGGRKRIEAEALYRQGIDVFRRKLGKAHFEVGFNLGQLAAMCQASGRLDEAAGLYAQALRIQRRALGRRHPVLARTLANLAALRREQGRLVEAMDCYREALGMYRRVLGARHPDTRGCSAAAEAVRRHLPATKRAPALG